MRKLLLCGMVFFFLSVADVYSQEIDVGDPELLVVRERQWDIYGTLSTNGLGIGFRLSKSPTIRFTRGFDFEYTYYRHFKERRTRINYNNVLVYGKLNYFGQLRAGYGFTRVLNTKPYWGGVEVGYFLYGGFSLGISVPVYVKIEEENRLVSQRYDPEKHTASMLQYGRDSFFKGIKNTKLHPGIYLKTGMSFDVAKDDALIVKLDFGMAADVYYVAVEKMAYVNKQYVLLTGFVTFHLGRRLANYE
jgi:hypothetical protein